MESDDDGLKAHRLLVVREKGEEGIIDDPGFSSCEDGSDFDESLEDLIDTRKKPKLFNSSQTASNGNENNCPRKEDALGNVLILQKIFSHFKTNFLLSSVSLVCKTWNREARKFIHNHRICSVRKPPGPDKMSNCEFFRQLDKLCCQMRQGGRPVPWNLLQLNFSEFSKECLPKFVQNDEDNYNAVIDQNMAARLKVKYLEIHGQGDQADCPVHKPVLNLLRHSSSKLRRLKIKIIFQLEVLFRHWVPHFSALEEIMIFSAPYDAQKQVELLKKLLDSAPKLKRIKYAGLRTLNIIPEDKFGLLDDLVLQFPDTIEDDDLMWKIAAREPRLRTLMLEPPRNPNFLPKFEKLLRQILQGCHQSLKTLDVYSGYSLANQFSHVSLPNLSKLFIENESGASLQDFWKSITSVDYCKVMPRLEEIEIAVNGDDRSEGKIEWPKKGGSDILHSCSTVRKLTLDLDVDVINLSQLKSVFPNVTTLKFRVDDSSLFDSDLPSLSEIWELFPHLEELKMKGEDNKLKRNFDADFCGISEEEAELLREQDAEYLKAVHIVPIRPSVLTMPNLRVLWIDLKFVPPPDLDNLEPNRLNFTSRVSEFVAFKRMNHATVRVCGVTGFNDICDLDDSDDDDDDDDGGSSSCSYENDGSDGDHNHSDEGSGDEHEHHENNHEADE